MTPTPPNRFFSGCLFAVALMVMFYSLLLYLLLDWKL